MSRLVTTKRALEVRNVPDNIRRRYEQNGWWTSETLGQIIENGLSGHPDNLFCVHSEERPFYGTFAEVETVARRLAAGLRARGVGPGDVIVFQLPNWMEAAATFWASSLLGAVVVPVVHFYGPKELAFILADAKPRVFITAERFGRMSHAPEVSAHVPVVGVVGSTFDDLLAPEPMDGLLPTDPDAPALIAYTSGTTRDPKGVIHTHQTLTFETRQLIAGYQPDRGRQLVSLPVGHFIGMAGAFLIPVIEGIHVDICDRWDPGRVIALMDSDEIGFGGGPPYFVTSLLDHPDFRPEHLRFVETIGLGGAAVPVSTAQRLNDLGIVVTRSYGSTEHPSITGTGMTAPRDKRLRTDGVPKLGVEIRLGDDGEIFSRGPDLCVGYTDADLTAAAFDADGWYRTGDVGVLDDNGYLIITDRKSDIIIRGGENVSATAVESTLLTMRAIADVAVVAMPDARFGERTVAAVRVEAGHEAPTLRAVHDHFAAEGVARQKWPEEVHAVDDFPRTASGKVQKHLLRKALADSGLGQP
ncbi:AMP-binding protein [Gordonia sp. CPCC 206044]|uniref:AMP-binding protein n=1 Tax=Gordonia sp. CPCC 206044 TaxID=3140793 RepID=UPI003AF39EEF